MNVNAINAALLAPSADLVERLPHLLQLARQPFAFRWDFGLGQLPEAPGIVSIRGPRQYGKSTWLEARLLESYRRHGPGSAFYLNGDEIASAEVLVELVRSLVPLYRPGTAIRRLFIDEITSVPGWERSLKRLVDGGLLRDVLVLTTGSRATDLRRGVERLPGRKGRLARSHYLFTPVPFREFRRVCGEILGDQTLSAYLLSGGAPVACSELAAHGRLPEWTLEMIRDWVFGECAATGRSRSALVAVMEHLARLGATPVGQAKLAREAGLANNTVAAGYLELLSDLMVVGTTFAWDTQRQVPVRRRPAKFPFVNLLAAVAWDRDRLRTPADLAALPRTRLGTWYEWLVAQELWRRAALRGHDSPEESAYWSAGDHEIDFVTGPRQYLEVKLGSVSPLEFAWFSKHLPQSQLTVISSTPFAAGSVRGITMDQFLEEEP